MIGVAYDTTENRIFTIILSIVGTIVIEKIIAPKIGKYKNFDECKIDINGFSLNAFKYNGK